MARRRSSSWLRSHKANCRVLVGRCTAQELFADAGSMSACPTTRCDDLPDHGAFYPGNGCLLPEHGVFRDGIIQVFDSQSIEMARARSVLINSLVRLEADRWLVQKSGARALTCARIPLVLFPDFARYCAGGKWKRASAMGQGNVWMAGSASDVTGGAIDNKESASVAMPRNE